MTEQLQFTISSELKNIIGRELITDDFIAIFELVKNSYDAKAKKVTLIFDHVREKSKKSRIIAIDDGIGMSRKDIEKKWLLVGHSWKKETQQKPQKDYRDKIEEKRIFAGAKGIGRFSCDRLGSKLKLYTKKEKERDIHVLEMDWDKFEEDPETNFQQINVDYNKINKLDIRVDNNFDKGSILEISSLRSKWDRKKLLRLKRHLQRLINPTQIDDKQEFQIYLKVEEEIDKDRSAKGDFDKVNGIVKNIVFEKLGIKTTRITCTIDEDGKKIHTELIDKGTFVYSLEEKNQYHLLKNVKLVIFYLNPVAKRAFTKIMGIQPVRYGSIFFYKNGIKINPCGNEGDDWLKLDRRKTQGTRRYLGNRDVIGRIEVNGYQPDFNEVTSRDGGVIKTPALVQLIDIPKALFFNKSLIRLEKFVIEGIAWDSETKPKDPEEIKADSFEIITKLADATKDEDSKIEFNKNLLDIYSKKQIEKTPEILKNIEHIKNLVKSKEARAYIDLQTKTVRSAFRNLRKTQRELERELRLKEKQALFLESTTSQDRKEILAIQHQIGLGAETIRRHLLRLKRKIEKGAAVTSSDLMSIIDNIILQVQLMSSFARAPFLTKAKFNLLSDEIKGDLALFIKQYIERVYLPFNEPILDGKKVTINVEQSPEIVFERDFSPSEFTVVLDNLISNSINANANQINIRINVLDEKTLEVKITDDGEGIKDKDLGKIFDFGFSTRGGPGIGLYHVRKILKKYGTISVNNRLEKGVEFTIEVQK